MTPGFLDQLQEKTKEAEEIILFHLPEKVDASDPEFPLIEAMRYSVEAGGKRLRPLLMMEMYRLFSGSEAPVEKESPLASFMAAMEYIHSYSLVHDDLPAMDDDLLRRGKPTTHAVYGEAMAILAGDALLNYAFEVVSEALLHFEENTSGTGDREDGGGRMALLCSFQALSGLAGFMGMIGGQAIDVEGEKTGTMDRNRLDLIYRRKTGALLTAAMTIGAYLGGAGEKETSVVKELSEKIGLAFQIRDDILDVTGTTEVLGKPVGSDEKNEKYTYVTYEGLAAAEKEVKRLTEEGLSLLASLGGDHRFLKELFLWLCERNR